MQIGFAPARWVLSHLNSQLSGKMAAAVTFIPFSTGVMAVTAGSLRLQNELGFGNGASVHG